MVLLGAAGVLALLLGGLTYARNLAYQSELSIWADTASRRPENPRAVGNLVFALGTEGRYDQAVTWARQALATQPGNAATYYSLAWALAGQARQWQAEDEAARARGAYEEAIGDYREAIVRYRGAAAVAPGDLPREYVPAHLDLAVALAAVGRKTEAEAEYQALIACADLPEAHNNLALLLGERGQYPEALSHLEKAVELKPDYPDAHFNLGRLLWRLDRPGGRDAALGQFETLLRLNPEDPGMYYEVAWLLATSAAAPQGAGPVAVEAAQRACALTQGRDPRCLDALAAAYAAGGRFGDALAVAGRALSLAEQHGQAQLAEGIRTRMQLYREGHPYREAHPVEPSTQPGETANPGVAQGSAQTSGHRG